MTAAARLPIQLQGYVWAQPGLLSLRLAPQQRPSQAAAAPVGSHSPPVAGAPCFSTPDSADRAAQPLPAPPAPSRFVQAAPHTQTHPPGGLEESPNYRLPGALHGTCPAGAPPPPPGSDLEGSGGPVGGSGRGGEERGAAGGWLSTGSAAGQGLHPAAGRGAALPTQPRHPSPGHKGTRLPAAPSPGRICWKPGA